MLRLEADSVAWNGSRPVTITVRLKGQPAYEKAIVRLAPTSSGSYGLSEPSASPLFVVDPKKGGRIAITIQALDHFEPDDGCEQRTLGIICLKLVLESVIEVGGARRTLNVDWDVDLSVRSPFAYPLTDPDVSHVDASAGAISCKRLPRTAVAWDLLAQISDLPNRRRIIWLHGPPGCGKTALLQDVQSLARKGLVHTTSSQWLPVLVHLAQANRAALASTWQFMFEINDRLKTVAETALGMVFTPLASSNEAIHSAVTGAPLPVGGALLVDKADYARDVYLDNSRELHKQLAAWLAATPGSRLLLMVDGFYYHEEDIGPELYRNLLRLSHLLDAAYTAYTLIVTDVMPFAKVPPFDGRMEHLVAKHPDVACAFEDLQSAVCDCACPLLTPKEVSAYVEGLFSPVQRIRDASLVANLQSRTRGHPTLLKGVLHRAARLYRPDIDVVAPVLSTKLCTALADRYEYLHFVTSDERKVWDELLAGQDPSSTLVGSFSRLQVARLLESLQKKGLAIPGEQASWPIK